MKMYDSLENAVRAIFTRKKTEVFSIVSINGEAFFVKRSHPSSEGVLYNAAANRISLHRELNQHFFLKSKLEKKKKKNPTSSSKMTSSSPKDEIDDIEHGTETSTDSELSSNCTDSELPSNSSDPELSSVIEYSHNTSSEDSTASGRKPGKKSPRPESAHAKQIRRNLYIKNLLAEASRDTPSNLSHEMNLLASQMKSGHSEVFDDNYDPLHAEERVLQDFPLMLAKYHQKYPNKPIVDIEIILSHSPCVASHPKKRAEDKKFSSEKIINEELYPAGCYEKLKLFFGKNNKPSATSHENVEVKIYYCQEYESKEVCKIYETFAVPIPPAIRGKLESILKTKVAVNDVVHQLRKKTLI